MKHTILMYFIMFATIALSFARSEAGEPASDFSLPDVDGKMHSLKDFKGGWVVLEWTNYDCPFVKKFYGSGEMQKLQKEYTAKGVKWISICSSAPGKQGHFTNDEIKSRMKSLDASPSIYLIDEKGEVGKMYDAKTTPYVVVINPQGDVVYTGAVDSIPSTDAQDIPKAKNYLSAALDEAMTGKPVSTPSTKSYGCSVKY